MSSSDDDKEHRSSDRASQGFIRELATDPGARKYYVGKMAEMARDDALRRKQEAAAASAQEVRPRASAGPDMKSKKNYYVPHSSHTSSTTAQSRLHNLRETRVQRKVSMGIEAMWIVCCAFCCFYAMQSPYRLGSRMASSSSGGESSRLPINTTWAGVFFLVLIALHNGPSSIRKWQHAKIKGHTAFKTESCAWLFTGYGIVFAVSLVVLAVRIAIDGANEVSEIATLGAVAAAALSCHRALRLLA